MKLSKESRYALEGLLVLARKKSPSTMPLHEIANKAEVPVPFLAKIFQKLSRAQIVNSSRGSVRGYALAHSPRDILLKDVLLAIEGNTIFDRCIFWSDKCADIAPCPLHFEWKRTRQRIAELMQQTTLAALLKNNRQ